MRCKLCIEDMYRYKPKDEGRLRVRIAVGGECSPRLSQAASNAAAELAELFAPTPKAETPGTTVEVRKKRHLESHADSMTSSDAPVPRCSAGAPPEEPRRPRVFALNR